MNEQIAKLAEQATIHSPEGFYTYTQIDAKKFAELIVQECAQIADDGFGSAHFGLGISGQMLKEHFGIDTSTK